MNSGRRKFVGGMAAAGAVIATANPIKAIASQLIVPEELKKGLSDGSTIMRVSLVELVNGRRTPCKDHPTHDLILRGNSKTPGAGDALIADQVSWEVERYMTIEGIRIFGGIVGGRPYQNFAWFAAAPLLQPGNTLNVSYTLTFNMDIMDEENRDKPLRMLADKSEFEKPREDRGFNFSAPQYPGFDRVNARKPEKKA